MTRKLHPTLPPVLETEIRSHLGPVDAEQGGVYIYITRVESQKSTTPPLREEDKQTIQRMFKAEKASAQELAKLYGKTRQTIYNVLNEGTR